MLQGGLEGGEMYRKVVGFGHVIADCAFYDGPISKFCTESRTRNKDRVNKKWKGKQSANANKYFKTYRTNHNYVKFLKTYLIAVAYSY